MNDLLLPVLVAATAALLIGYWLGWRDGRRSGVEQVERRVRAVLTIWGERNPLDAQQLRRQIGIEDGDRDG